MKFLLSVFVYLAFAFFMSWGIYSMMHGGKPWLLVASFGAYLAIATKKGCLDTH